MDWLQLLSYSTPGQKKEQLIDKDNIRSAFERDYDRIIFSHPFRRLQDKTQVFPMPEHDFVHSRLTHSLEVSSVGRSLGKKAGKRIIQLYPELQKNNFTQFDIGAIVAAACLTHDLGNPPFGHAGEDAISDFFLNNPVGQFFKNKVSEKEWADLTDFEGNAQGFRLLNKGNFQGLKITCATLAAFTKYPRESKISSVDDSRKSQKKYGFFQHEREAFQALAEETGLKKLSSNADLVWCRHPLSFLVEAADDICYNIIDLEDGCRLGLVTYEETIALLSQLLGERFKAEKLEKLRSADEKIGLLRAMAINILIDQCADVFIHHEKEILNGSFDKALSDLVDSKQVLDQIKGLSIEKIYRSRPVLETEAAGFEVLEGLLESFVSASYAKVYDPANFSKKHQSVLRLLPDEFKPVNSDQKDNPYKLLMNVIDYIASMTDTFAISLYRKIKGISLPRG